MTFPQYTALVPAWKNVPQIGKCLLSTPTLWCTPGWQCWAPRLAQRVQSGEALLGSRGQRPGGRGRELPAGRRTMGQCECARGSVEVTVHQDCGGVFVQAGSHRGSWASLPWHVSWPQLQWSPGHLEDGGSCCWEARPGPPGRTNSFLISWLCLRAPSRPHSRQDSPLHSGCSAFSLSHLMASPSGEHVLSQVGH